LEDRDQRRLTDQGLGGIAPEEGLQILGQLLAQDIPQVGVLPVDWSVFLQHSSQAAESPFFKTLTAASPPPAEREPVLLQQLEKTPAAEHRALLTAHIRAEIAQVLEFSSPEQVEPRQRLFDLGVDSLMAVELRDRLHSGLGHPLRSTLLFDYPTVEGLVDYLLEEVLAFSTESADPPLEVSDAGLTELEQLSEAEAESLLLAELEKLQNRKTAE